MSKKTSLKLCASFAAMALSATSAAQGVGAYAGGNAAFLDFTADGARGDASLTAIYGRVGTHFNENISAELRLGLGLSDDSIGLVDVDLESLVGGYVRAGLPVTDVIYPYAVIGYTRAEADFSGAGFRGSESETDVSFGVGADFAINRQLTINVEYMNYLDQDDAEFDGFAIGVATSF